MGSKAGNILKVVAPIALSFAVPALAPALGITSTAGQTALGVGLGAATGAATGGGLKGALIGGATTGLGTYLNASGGLSGLLGGASDITSAASGVANPAGLLTGSLSSSPAASGGLASLIGNTGISGTQALSAAGNLYSGIQGTQAAKDMAKAQQKANADALALQSKMYDQTTANLSPFLTTGQSANKQLSDLLGISGNTGAEGYGSLTKPFKLEDFQADPGYQFRLAEGTKAMNQSLGAKGSLFSGEALKAAQDFGQNLANQTYNDAYTRYVQDQNNTYSKLNSTAGAGQQAAANQGASGASYANNAGQLLSNVGDIKANQISASNNAQNQGLAGLIGGNYNYGQSSYQTGVDQNIGKKLVGYDANGKPIYA